MKALRSILTGILLLMLLPAAVQATHLRAADIVVERICGTRSFKITVIAYLNTTSSTRFGTNSQVYFGDGLFVNIPLTNATFRPDLGTNISVATFTTTHTYSTDGIYTIGYIERDRSGGVLNIVKSDDVPYVTFVTIDTNPAFGCNHFPTLSVIPLDRACTGITFFHNSGAYDVDGDSLSYEMSVPASGLTTFAQYDDPNKQRFYNDYTHGNENKNGPPVFFIDAVTGLLTFDAPGMIGEYNIAFKIIEWRKDQTTGVYHKLSTTTRDMQLVVEDCNNSRPDLILPADLCVVEGTTVSAIIKGIDAENDPVRIEAFSEIFDFADEPATITPGSGTFVPSSPPAEVTLTWKTNCNHVRQQPYRIVFKITDNPPQGPKLVSFRTLSIQVIAPKPALIETALDVERLHGILKWDNHACSNVHSMQVWRKVDSYPYSPDVCQIGIPPGSGYQFIATVPSSQNTFTDTNFGLGLVPGARYCYRIVALIRDTKSYVSDEMCIGPVRADAPVITHVSVEKTDVNGTIRVSWRSPFDIDNVQFPEPYRYQLFRAVGFIGDTLLHQVGLVTDTTFLDDHVSSFDSVYNYRIVVYAKPEFSSDFIPVDTSAAASSVRLQAIPQKKSIVLQWQDSVPWSNVVFERPYHLIYRAEGKVSDSELELIDSALVTSDGFYYADFEVDETQLYSYKIVTRGTYGNSAIRLQENFSQMIYAYPENDLLPCVPLVKLDTVDCDTYLNSGTCFSTEFNNTLLWEISDDHSCRADIVRYKIYGATSVDGEFALLSVIEKKEFTEYNLPSFARCYRISAVDSQGHESELSDPVCNDNCPFFMLPNVFTPNGDGCNDLFTARYSIGDTYTMKFDCPVINENFCPRFVSAVDIVIYNRWGTEVYQQTSRDKSSIYVDWNGKDKNGNEASAGIYYFVADVTFDALSPERRSKVLRGWVHLIR
jgi:hypothetical protein